MLKVALAALVLVAPPALVQGTYAQQAQHQRDDYAIICQNGYKGLVCTTKGRTLLVDSAYDWEKNFVDDFMDTNGGDLVRLDFTCVKFRRLNLSKNPSVFAEFEITNHKKIIVVPTVHRQ